jgi:hypothetical protein
MNREEWLALDGRLTAIQFMLEVVAAMVFAGIPQDEQDAGLKAINELMSNRHTLPPDASPEKVEYIGDFLAIAEDRLRKITSAVALRANDIRRAK